MDAPAPPAPPEPPPPRPLPHAPLRRDRAHRVLGGVAAGIARTYGIDVTLVRVLWVVAGVFWIGIPAYVIAWIAIPPGDGDDAGGPSERPRDLGMLAGLTLIGIGLAIGVGHWLPSAFDGGRFGAPVLLIAGGVAILVLRRPGDPDAPLLPGAEAPTASPPPDAEAPTAAIPPDAPPASDAPTAPLTPTAPLPDSAWTQTAPWPTARDTRRAARADRRQRRPRAFLGPLTVSVLLIGAGVTTMLQALDVVEVNLTVALAIATCVVGAALVLSAWVGRARGLIFLGILLAGATAVSSAIDVPLRGGFGEEVHQPFAVAELRSPYELGAGHLVLDLRRVEFPAGVTTVEASVGVGRLEVDVPGSVDVVVDAHAGAGSTNLFGRQEGGWRHDEQFRFPATPTAVGAVPAGTLHLKLRVGAGEIDVHRYEPGNIETRIGARP